MLVIANGAPKSGSTWLYNILEALHDFEPIPAEFKLDPDNVNPEIQYDRLEDFLKTLDYSEKDYVIKNHFGKPEHRDLILRFDNVYVLDIDRSIKDVVVSGYYYKMGSLKPEKREHFEYYYWREGRYLADLVRGYHETWKSAPSDRALTVSYENLKKAFDIEALKIGQFLGFELSPEKIREAEEKTSMTKLRKKYKDDGDIKFFRKGEIGDWKNHIQGSALRDIVQIELNGVEGLRWPLKIRAKIKKHFVRKDLD